MQIQKYFMSLTKDGIIDTITITADSPSQAFVKLCIRLVDRVLFTIIGKDGNKKITHYTLYKDGAITLKELRYIGVGCSLQVIREDGLDEALRVAGYDKRHLVPFFNDGTDRKYRYSVYDTTDYICIFSEAILNIENGKRADIEKRTRVYSTVGRFRHSERTKNTDDNTINTKSLNELKEKQDYKCYHCEKILDFNVKNSVHLDHYIPLSKGGTHTIGNVVWSCSTCNLVKSATVPKTLLLL